MTGLTDQSIHQPQCVECMSDLPVVDVGRNIQHQMRLNYLLVSSFVMSTMLYGAELWLITVVQKKNLEAAHHKL